MADDVLPLRSLKAEMAGAQCDEQDTCHISLMYLPEHILNKTFAYLDEDSLCKVAQTCRLFLRLAGTQRTRQDRSLVAGPATHDSSILLW